ncbi:MAG: methionyl-tRNA formyltransferase [Bacteroides sp.]|nr:methionyl-tRNA formyltransferase [Eubacterium sp.]MCM1417947.1 methionyl-tRNA formyltransferase [Roseburia sp.]MCM1461806.1 methionyl-tRNA formyltransferase [Bacteroides sp.]
MNIVFMGTPDFAVPSLDALIAAGHTVSAVFTQPDKPKNRGQKLLPPPVKKRAEESGIAVYQPLSLRKGEDAERSLETLRRLSPDAIVVAAYGQILPKAILDLPRYGCINVHASLLPKYRGAAPIQHCIINGETTTGVTIMYMAEGLDTGDMILWEEVAIPETMTASALHDRLSAVGASLLLRALDRLADGTAERLPQGDENSCYASMLSKEMCRIDFTKPAAEVYNFIRGMSASPCAFTTLGGKRLKVYFAEKTGERADLPPGTAADDRLSVACGDGETLRLVDLQYEGAKRMGAEDFLRGRRVEKGTILGE